MIVTAGFLCWLTPAVAETNKGTPEKQPATVVEDRDSSNEQANDDGEVYETLELKPFQVTTTILDPVKLKIEKAKLDLYFQLGANFGWPFFRRAFVQTPTRTPQKIERVPQSLVVAARDQMRFVPPFFIKDLLLDDPGCALVGPRELLSGVFPQRLTMRGLNALVFVDGAPINDPFGGWVHWAEVPRESLARMELVSGGAASWGNGAVGGVIQFLTQPLRGKLVIEKIVPADGSPPDPAQTKRVIHPQSQFAMVIGNSDTHGIEFVSSQPTSRGVLQVLGGLFHTEGISTIDRSRRGPVDVAASLQSQWIEVKWRQPLGANYELNATIRTNDEYGDNGTAYQQFKAQGTFASVTIAGTRDQSFSWNSLVYVRRDTSSNRFSVVGADRSFETPVFDQSALPTISAGANWTGLWRRPDGSWTNAGIDIRYVRGESREEQDYSPGSYLRHAVAGGAQEDTAAFITHDWALSHTLRATAAARLEYWEDFDGHNRLINERAAEVTTQEQFRNTGSFELSPSIGIVWQPSRAWSWHTSSQRGYRHATLAERYQTIGKYNDVAAPNPELRVERDTTFESGLRYSFSRNFPSGRPPPRWAKAQIYDVPALFTLEAKGYATDSRDPIVTKAIMRGSGAAPQFDNLPANYLVMKQENLGGGYLHGLELSATWHPTPGFESGVQMEWNDGGVAAAKNRTIQVRSTWQLTKAISAICSWRLFSRQRIDGNTGVSLNSAAVVDLGATYMLDPRVEFYIKAKNITNSRVEISRSNDGLAYLGSPRILLGGFRLRL